MRRYVVPGTALLVLLTAATGCGGGEGSAVKTVTSTVTVTSSATTPALPSSSVTDGASASASVPQSSSVDSAGVSTGPPILTGITSAPKRLVLSDVFDHNGWDEGSVSVPRHGGTIQGIWTRMSCSNRSALELRFADQKGVLKIDVAQALDSTTSGVVLEFQLFTDGRLADSKLVKFNSQGHLETGLTGVSAVRLEVRRHPSSTTCNATAVVTEMSVTPGP